MNRASIFTASFKYVYLIAFFALLAGFFHPLIANTTFDTVTNGALVLFVGLFGGVLLYWAGTTDKKRAVWIYLGCGFGLILLSLHYVFQMSGRII